MRDLRRKEGDILILRYASILMFLFSMILMQVNISFKSIILILIYIINTQIRYYFVPQKNLEMMVSILIDLILGYLIYSMLGIKGFFAFIPALLDISIFLSNKIVIIFSTVVSLVIVLYLIPQYTDMFSYIMTIVTIVVLGQKAKNEGNRKHQAQQLYDKLRITEEELKKANDELQGCVNTIEEIAVLRERNRISREIHDNVGHALSTIIIQLGAIEKIAKTNGEAASSMSANLGEFTRESLQGVRDAVKEMKPKEFEEYEGILAISEMIKNFEKLTGVTVRFRVSENAWKLNSEQTMVIYRIIQEFLSNSVRHGKATEVNVFMNFKEKYVRVHLKDNGIGCVDIKEGCGLKGIRERISPWAGSLKYESEDDKGFELAITMEKIELSIKEEN